MANPNPLNPAPWRADSLPWALQAETVETIYSVETASGYDTVCVHDAVNVEVDLDANRSPYATARWEVPGPYQPGDETEAPGFRSVTNPRATIPVLIKAGWRRTIGGVQVDDLQTVFYGLLTRRTWRDGRWTFEAASADLWWSHPANRSYNVANSATSISQVAAALAGAGSKLLRDIVVTESGLDAPTTAQLAIFREMEFDIGDDVDTWVHACADSLGQWVRGDHRNRAGAAWPRGVFAPRYWITPRPTLNVDTPLTLDSVLTDFEGTTALDDWGNLVELTAKWVESGTQKTSTAFYSSEFASSGIIAVKKVEANVRPYVIGSTRVLTSTWPAGVILANDAAYRASRVSATCRALWWLEPGMTVVLNDVPGFYCNGNIKTVKLLVDQGLMALTYATGLA